MRFETTRWNLIALATSANSDEEAIRALEQLCMSYWPPLCAYARSRGLSAEDAKDATQGFFAQMLEKHTLERARRERGKFRNFLLASMTHFMTNEWHRDNAWKRRGDRHALPLDGEFLGQTVAMESDLLPPDRAYEVQWARTLLARALARLEEEHGNGERRKRFRAFRGYVTADLGRTPSAQLAAELGMSTEAVRTAIHRLRARYGELIRAEVGETLGPDDDPDEEIRYLLAVLSAR